MTISVSAIAQVLILYLVIYAILRGAKGSRFGQVLMGIGVLATCAAVFTYVLHFDVLAEIVRLILIYLALSTVVIFQPEIRRILSTMGAFGYLDRPRYTSDGAATPDFITQTILSLSNSRMGALIAFERGISLRGYEDTGVPLGGATISGELVRCIFTPPLPLHDGGLTIRDGRISAAHCIFPVSNNADLISRGMRHRAAVGLSEETDAFVVVVSEESGTVSVAHNGRLFPCTGKGREQVLRRWISRAMHTNADRTGPFQAILVQFQAKLLNLLKGENAA